MDAQIIYQRLTPIFQDVFDDDTLIPCAEMTPGDVKGWDSLTNIRLFVAVEKAFGIRFATHEVTRIQSVGDFVQCMIAKLAPSKRD